VPSARLELAQPKPLPPQDSVSTNSTTTACLKQGVILAFLKNKGKINSIKIVILERSTLPEPQALSGFAWAFPLYLDLGQQHQQASTKPLRHRYVLNLHN